MTIPRTPVVSGATGLSINPNTLGISASESKGIAAALGTFRAQYADMSAKVDLEAMRETPPYALARLKTEDLTTLDANQYTRTYTEQLGWYGYLTMELAIVRAQLLQTTNQLELIEATLRRRLIEQNKALVGRDKLSQEEIRTYILTDVDYQAVTIEHQKLSQQKVLLEASVSISEMNLKVVSRQVEIRRNEDTAHSSSKNQPMRPQPVTRR